MKYRQVFVIETYRNLVLTGTFISKVAPYAPNPVAWADSWIDSLDGSHRLSVTYLCRTDELNYIEELYPEEKELVVGKVILHDRDNPTYPLFATSKKKVKR